MRDLRTSPVASRGARLTFEFDGREIVAYEGETIAAALLASGFHRFRWTERGAPRSYYCGMGICHDCLVIVNGQGSVRSCMEPARAGMVVVTVSAPADARPT